MRDETMLRRIIVAMALIMIGVALGYFWRCQSIAYSACMEYAQPAGWVAEPRTIAAMAYHGVSYAASDADGVLWFTRDGQKCTLINAHFLAQWVRK